MSYNCPQCESPQTSSFEMLYNQGTTSGNLSAMSYNGGVGFTGGQFNSQTQLAGQLSPPAAPKLGAGPPLALFAGSVILTLLILTVISRMLNAVGSSLPGNGVLLFLVLVAAMTGGGIYLCQRDINRNKMPVYTSRLREWSNSMICRRCGFMWIR